MRVFFVVARVWCVPARVSRVACVGGVRVVVAAWRVGPAWSRDITGALRVSRIFFRGLTYTLVGSNAVDAPGSRQYTVV